MTVANKLEGAVVDSSPIMSIFERRSSAPAFRQGLRKSAALYMSAGTLMELSMIFIGKKTVAGIAPLDDLLAEFNIEVVPLDALMVKHGRYGCANFGKGHSPADLNMGDLFSYSLAKQMVLPLFFEGLDFPKTDIQDAMLMLGYAFDQVHSPRMLPQQLST
jgi:ribonuclease VapC